MSQKKWPQIWPLYPMPSAVTTMVATALLSVGSSAASHYATETGENYLCLKVHPTPPGSGPKPPLLESTNEGHSPLALHGNGILLDVLRLLGRLD